MTPDPRRVQCADCAKPSCRGGLSCSTKEKDWRIEAVAFVVLMLAVRSCLGSG